ncbi:hypothetical protein MIND_00755000 [Mycena indigotica]|uniref:Uncharacterized protein n=1 Tax=Mycena indigotica TaxID=2126181 RepID=A0A8H6SN35_9AGAR|nr:uncharacterized protein MIND_00755000 [Mycena indigotica]KAF7301890.1 hypothetical protein MIND_00755000 [Mycena indigotica]
MPLLQPTIPPLPATLSFTGKTVIVTGATAGLGLEAALQLAQRDVSTLVLAVRKPSLGESTKAAILHDPIVRTRSTPPKIHIYELDLARPSSVASFARKIREDLPELHILLLNAGMGGLAWVTTPETNFEQMFQVNFLSNVLLAIQLLPLLRATAQKTASPSHLTFVGSRMTRRTSFISNTVPDSTGVYEFMNDPKKFSISRYADSKTLVAMWVTEAAKRIPPSEVIINHVCPGMVKTNINDAQPLYVRIIVNIVLAIRARTADVGARTFLAAINADEHSHGEFLADFDVEKVQFLQTPAGKKMQEKLWKETTIEAVKHAAESLQESGLD